MTYNELISSAMRAIRTTQAGESPQAHEYAVGIERLNEMVSGWRNAGLQMDWSNLDSADGGNTVAFDEEDVLAVRLNLSLALCDDYGKTPSPMMMKNASVAYSGLFVKWFSGPAMRVDDTLMPSRWPGMRTRGSSTIFNG